MTRIDNFNSVKEITNYFDEIEDKFNDVFGVDDYYYDEDYYY